MTDQTNPIVEAVQMAVMDAAEEISPRYAKIIARAAILAHTQALMENVSEEMVSRAWYLMECDGGGELHSDDIPGAIKAALAAHMEQMK